MLIQFILIAVIAVIIIRLIYKLKNKEIAFNQFFSWLAVWLAAIIVVLYPQVASWLASVVGIGRGADLVVYVSIIIIFYSLFKIILRLEKMEKNITKLVREEALKDNNQKNEQ